LNHFFKNKFLLLTATIICFSAAYLLHHDVDGIHPNTITKFQKILNEKEQHLSAEMSILAKQAKTKGYDQLFAEKPTHYNTLLENEGIALLIYENDTLKFWSDNSIAVENWMKEVCLDTRIVKLRNGWFEVMKPESNYSTSKTVVGLILIKSEFPYENKYLVNEFQSDFQISAETKLLVNPSVTNNQITTNNGDYLFSLQFGGSNDAKSMNSYFALILALLGFVFVVVLLMLLQ
jgi:hypothetical protein